MTVHALPRHRAIQVYFIPPTDHRGDRVCIKDLRRGDRITLSYSYKHGDILEQAYEYLQAKGFAPDFTLVLADELKGYILSTSDFTTEIR